MHGLELNPGAGINYKYWNEIYGLELNVRRELNT